MGDLRNQYPRVYDRVFRQRNRNWLDTLEELIRSGDRVMVIVGSGHLIGEDGLITLLDQRGYRFDKLDAEG
jgi:uncharacterized protein YbaP (TraB family)